MTAYVVETTAAGTAAIAVLEVVGPEAEDAIGRAFGPRVLRPDRPLHTMIADGDGELDDVVLVFRPAEESMTGWPHVEIQCHGSPAIVRRVRRALVAVGVKPAPKTFLLRTAVRNRRMTRLEEEAWLAATSALTERAAKELWEQRKALPEIAARIGDSRDRKLLLELLATREHGRALRRPLRIAFVGKPNAGKSSLVNALAGRERVLVDPRPGTTRDAIEVPIAIDGIPLVLIDTAGLRETAESTEKDGIDIARRAIRRADVVFYLKDLTDSGPGLPIPGSFLIWTKADLAPGTESRPPGFCLSVVTGEHLSNLENELVCKTRAAAQITADGAFLFTPRQVKRVRDLLDGPDLEWQDRWERWVWGRPRKPE